MTIITEESGYVVALREAAAMAEAEAQAAVSMPVKRALRRLSRQLLVKAGDRKPLALVSGS